MRADIPSKTVPCITINTDASFHPHKKVGGYAFYIVCNEFRIQRGGPFKAQPKTPMEAEMMCMANALAYLLERKDLPRTSWIVINSDCLFSFERIGRKSQDPIGRKISKLMSKLRKETAMREGVLPKYEFRHVKAHNGTPDSRSYVNDWCDTEAKKHMRLLASQIPNKKHDKVTNQISR